MRKKNPAANSIRHVFRFGSVVRYLLQHVRRVGNCGVPLAVAPLPIGTVSVGAFAILHGAGGTGRAAGRTEEGDPVLEVHIPAGGRLTETACDDSLALAREFFGKFFPDFRYTCFTCHSWLLDEGLRNLLPCDSHILAFGNRFLRLHGEKSDAILRYLFKWNTTRQTLTGETPVSSFAAKVKNYALSGGDFYEVWGVLRADG